MHHLLPVVKQVNYEVYEVNDKYYELYEVYEEFGFFPRDVPVEN